MEQTALILHGHFYQPPRENPWTGEIEEQAGARPFHDWNERIHSECYRANAFARIADSEGRVASIRNNYAGVSFDFGPTLLSWLERQHPATYLRVVEADAESSRRRSGHGNAIAQGYHHSILPLCNERDRRTEIRWGLADFRHRFRREPESLWLPETACDSATLCALVEEGLKFVVLSPTQAGRVRPLAGGEWRAVEGRGVDATQAYFFRHTDGTGRGMAIFFYDGAAARAIAFEGALASSRGLLDNFERAAGRGSGRLVNAATDGESYGHHFKFGDLCLAHALDEEAARRGFRLTNYGEFLEQNPPEWEVELAAWKGDGEGEGEGTAWSCAHGLGRWTRDCGCNADAPAGWSQNWRGPLRRALNFLRDEAARVLEERGGALLRDPWAARDHYVGLLLDASRDREEFFREHAGRTLPPEEQARARALLEMQRGSLMTFTSCGWFFNDISGIETVQVLRYAARTLELMEESGAAPPRAQFLELLAEAESNVPGVGNGADVFRSQAEAARRAASHPDAAGAARGAAGSALLRMLRERPTRENIDGALAALSEVQHLDAHSLRELSRLRIEELLALAVGAASASRPEDALERVASLVRLAAALGFEYFFERAQEVVYESIRRAGAGDSEGLRALASGLRLSPALFGDAGAGRARGEGSRAPARS